MILEIILDEKMKPCDKILQVLYDVGYATKQQLADILNWDVYKVQNQLYYVRKHYETKGQQWIDYENLGSNMGRPQKAYCLTKYAINQLKEIRGIDTKVKPPKPIQLYHYLGITEILARLLKALGVQNYNRLEWWSEQDSRNFVLSNYVQKIKSTLPNTQISQSVLMKCVAPDAYLRVLRQSFWIEFDNNTENGKKLQDRYMRYVNTMFPRKNGHNMILKQIDFPVIWITKSETRRRFMEMKWDEVRTKSMNDIKNPRTNFPKMYFLVEGNETQFLIEYAKQLANGPVPSATPKNSRIGM